MYSGETTFTRMEVDSYLISQGFTPDTPAFRCALRLVYEPTSETGIYVERTVPVPLKADEFAEIGAVSMERAFIDLYDRLRIEDKLLHAEALTAAKRQWFSVNVDD